MGGRLNLFHGHTVLAIFTMQIMYHNSLSDHDKMQTNDVGSKFILIS